MRRPGGQPSASCRRSANPVILHHSEKRQPGHGAIYARPGRGPGVRAGALAHLEEVHDPSTVRQFTGECFERELDKSIFEARRQATPRCAQSVPRRATTNREAVDAATHLGLITWTYRPRGNPTRPCGCFAAALHTSGRRFDTVRAHQGYCRLAARGTPQWRPISCAVLPSTGGGLRPRPTTLVPLWRWRWL